jgi:hypothetical protein
MFNAPRALCTDGKPVTFQTDPPHRAIVVIVPQQRYEDHHKYSEAADPNAFTYDSA